MSINSVQDSVFPQLKRLVLLATHWAEGQEFGAFDSVVSWFLRRCPVVSLWLDYMRIVQSVVRVEGARRLKIAGCAKLV